MSPKTSINLILILVEICVEEIMEWNKFIIMHKFEDCVRMENSEEYREKERNGLRVFVNGREPRGHPL